MKKLEKESNMWKIRFDSCSKALNEMIEEVSLCVLFISRGIPEFLIFFIIFISGYFLPEIGEGERAGALHCEDR